MSIQQAQAVASRLNIQPMLLAGTHASEVINAIRQMSMNGKMPSDDEVKQYAENMLSAYGYNYVTASSQKPFLYADGVAFIPVNGLLINRFSSSWGFVTGYNFIRSQLNAALEDEDVTLIVFDCNSGGGEVAGCFELCADIVASRAIKPSLAVVDSASLSACYAVASSASRIIVTPSGTVGSIGVVVMHVNYSKWLEEAGIGVEFIYSGDHKVDGNPYEELPEPVRKSIKARVDSTRQQFATLVADNRGLDVEAVLATEAACYSAQQALELGLIDAIAPPLEAVSAFFNFDCETEEDMATNAVSQTGMQNAANQAANAAANEAKPNVDAAALKAAERERISAIINHAEADGRSALANHLALNTELTVEAAAAILAASAKETKQSNEPKNTQTAADSGASPFNQAMNESRHPNVDAEGSATEMSAAQRILAAQALATGIKRA